jgi:hypothetical protein
VRPAPELSVTTWMNIDQSPSLTSLRGRVVVLQSFQIHCPACVNHSIPQTERLHRKFHDRDDIAILGLHSVFEDHETMGPDSLKAFLTENDLTFPVGVDRPRKDSFLPETMSAYDMQGTPTLILIDRSGNLRIQHFGIADDASIEAAIERLLGESYG